MPVIAHRPLLLYNSSKGVCMETVPEHEHDGGRTYECPMCSSLNRLYNEKCASCGCPRPSADVVVFPSISEALSR